MLEIVNKDIFTSQQPVIVHVVNCNGKMGAGLSQKFRYHFPVNYKRYQEMCTKRQGFLGRVLYTRENGHIVANLFVENLQNEVAPGRLIDYNALRVCLKNVNSLRLPAALPYGLGCGHGGGNWEEILKIIKEELKDIPVEICRI